MEEGWWPRRWRAHTWPRNFRVVSIGEKNGRKSDALLMSLQQPSTRAPRIGGRAGSSAGVSDRQPLYTWRLTLSARHEQKLHIFAVN